MALINVTILFPDSIFLSSNFAVECRPTIRHNVGSYTQAGSFPINCPRKAAF